jgi:hypothetical protein
VRHEIAVAVVIPLFYLVLFVEVAVIPLFNTFCIFIAPNTL